MGMGATSHSTVWDLGTKPRVGVFDQMGSVESQLDEELEAERVELRTKGNSPLALRNSTKGRELQGFVGTMPECFVVPETIRSLLQIPLLPRNLLKTNFS